MKKSLLCFILVFVVLLCSCGSRPIKVKPTETGFYDEENDINYIPCTYLTIKPLMLGDVYATEGDRLYYKIPFEDPKLFLGEDDQGIYYLFKSETVGDINMQNFEPIAAQVYTTGILSMCLDIFQPEWEYFQEAENSEGWNDDSALVYAIRDAFLYDEKIDVPSSRISDEDQYFIRLLSREYPGLYFMVVFFTDINGTAFLRIRDTNETVKCPDNVVMRITG